MTPQRKDRPTSLRRCLVRLVVAAIEEYGRGIAVTAPAERWPS